MSIATIHHNSLEYLAAENIAVPHGFTTRFGGLSEGYLDSLNIGMHRGDSPENVAENYRRLADAMGFSPEKLVLANQTHSDIVRVVTEKDCLGSLSHRDYPECDALVTNTAGLALVVFTADCTPILFYDPITGAVGAAHAGWRGTANGIAAKTVDAMVTAFGCRREHIRAAIGPNIGPCCFETDGDVPAAMLDAFGQEADGYIRQKGEKYFVDLKGLNALWLRRSGVTDIAIAAGCTCCAPHRFWSHRATKGVRGSQGAIILCQ
ncbi:MAG: peptidoglycan editing factor PgeF [Oscillospiraceae bacterium]|nr:peptidoglycan editing factor PgeF [Oscillospiraceae bacterium]